ncbi:MAG: alpha/beta hydrolase, partial [Bradymonadaceae bacterium]
HRSFHLPGRSLAEWLAERGHEVWLPELRGHGASEVSGWDWRFDDHLLYDAPAIVEFVLRVSGADAINWVGHSMGGMLLLCYGIHQPDAPIARGITIGSAIDYRVGDTGFEQLLAARAILSRFTALPYGTLAHLLAPTIGRGPDALVEFNVWPSNIEGEVSRRLHSQCFGTIPVSLLESLSTTFDEEGLRLDSGFQFLEHAPQLDFPIRLLAGSHDRQVDIEAVEKTAELVGANAEVNAYGEPWGERMGYGHFDLILGRRAPCEVWPDIAAFIES